MAFTPYAANAYNQMMGMPYPGYPAPQTAAPAPAPGTPAPAPAPTPAPTPAPAPGTPAPTQPTGPAFTFGQNMYQTGNSLLGQPVAGNGFGQVQMQNPTATVSPWLNRMGDNITNRTQNFLDTNLMNIQGNSVATGGLGGARQGVAQAGAISQAADYLSGNLANMYGNAWDNAANRSLAKYNTDTNFYNQQRGQDLAGVNVGANLIQGGLNTQWIPINNAANVYSQFSGFGDSSSTSESGGGWGGAAQNFFNTLALQKYL